MNEDQEPVAWMAAEPTHVNIRFCIGKDDPSDVWGQRYVPLYLHPSAELTALRERIAGMEKDAERLDWLIVNIKRHRLYEHKGHWFCPPVLAQDWQPGHKSARDAIDAAIAKQDRHCRCPACATGTFHASDCAVHNGPALPVGECDCGAKEPK